MGRSHLQNGGYAKAINAVKKNHGPSWRMIVEMTPDGPHAQVVYPGGQSGNPGSKYYATFINNWAAGKYYRLVFLPNATQQNNKAIKYTWEVVNCKL